ncbi:uncharacterized protein BP5553_05032 [Venustampulla echinocandica]|uniref:C2H2-type domain-containing protein n=1 Tax=Venustampulla echinocandica TaxID=2656787 RepID=A0A370TQ01_9HELO|nr:uncharacterized protein BP5553_05032 [Venustampulla echinocandica]RDL37599.1 hypothetical protein BP5553_05032 [Venustampulla echinocandica]
MASQPNSYVRPISSKPRYTPYDAAARPKALGGVPMDHTWSDISTSSELSNTTTYSVPSSCTTMELDHQGDLAPTFGAGYSNDEAQVELGGPSNTGYSNEILNYDAPQSIPFTAITESMPFSFQSQRPTPLGLEWMGNMKVLDFYDLVVEKSKEPYLVLRDEFPEYPRTPRIVYLDRDMGQAARKDYHPCQFPDNRCWKRGKTATRPVFRRPADLERHYVVVHASAQSFPCDYQRCNRKRNAFTRKDHCRDHFKEFHKEDIGHCKGEKSAKNKAERQAKEQAWLDERKIDPKWWRCAKCLERVRVAKAGWQCSSCKRDCEPHRKKARLGQQVGADVYDLEMEMSRQASLSTYGSGESQLKVAGTADMYDVGIETTHPAPSSPYDSDEGLQSMAGGSESQRNFDEYEQYPREACMDHLAEAADVYDMGYKASPQVSSQTYDGQKYLQDLVGDSESYSQYHNYPEQLQFDDVTWSSPRPW